ncbi:MAG: 3-deoxy-manno-octulosonate cytidylyltransferase [Gammaproteobacteria bacterium RIFCSPHIGHO2_12_FULL_35_23]|nr:MAG: 3-deoxy-manno-octulosonate cytidylyltransferase [Gammaproteobacteria bacterium RIFCSPHIGHO2_12_FULL_35_23]
MKIWGIVPARMASSRFPGKPLFPILNRPMIEHVFCRTKMFTKWDGLYLATCDKEIENFAISKSYPVIMTSNKHIRCLDRVAEAISKCGVPVKEHDIVACVQGDEPMLHPDMIAAAIKPLEEDSQINGTVLAMAIGNEAQFINPDTVKIIHDLKGNVLYTSRSPVPYCEKFNLELGARRIYGIFAFRWHFLKTFTQLPESPLELKESCDSNRILDHGYRQTIAPYPYRESFSVDSPKDIGLVEAHMKNDSLWGKY